MNSHRMSVGKKFLYPLFVLFFCQCSHSPHRPRDFVGSSSNSGEEVSLDSDQKAIEELRKNIPPGVRLRNNELKVIMSGMGELKEHPQRVREKFNHFQRKQRSRFQKEYNNNRSDFTQREKKERDMFLKKMNKKREQGRTQKLDREQRNAFYTQLENERKDFFDEQKNQRREFESEMQQKSRDFYAHLREQQNEFNVEWRIYNKRWQDWQQEKNKRSSVTPNKPFTESDLKGFQQLQNAPGEQLSTDNQ